MRIVCVFRGGASRPRNEDLKIMRDINKILILPLLLMASTFSYAQKYTIDTSSFYFPNEVLLKKHLDAYWRNDSTSLAVFSDELGHEPDSLEMDSLIDMRLKSLALSSNRFYSSFLQELGEPVLCNGYFTTVYRQTWFQNELKADYSPYSIRIEEDENGGHVAYFSYRLWDWKWKVPSLHHDTIAIDENSWENFVYQIGEYGFGEKPSMLDTLMIVFGGSTCILESWENGKYHAVFRNCSLDPKICELQKYMWRLIGMRRKMPDGKPGLLSRIIRLL